MLDSFLDLLRCPRTGQPLTRDGDALVNASGDRYRINALGVPLFAEELLTHEARIQQEHYDRIAKVYLEHQDPEHVREYLAFADRLLLEQAPRSIGTLVEVCSGHGHALTLAGLTYERGIGVDVSEAMVSAGQRDLDRDGVLFTQGDATQLPLADDVADAVFCLGGIHHVPDRVGLFSEVRRVLRPGGRFLFREPLDDFLLWRAMRSVIYRVSPTLDAETEEPLRRATTERDLGAAGLRLASWRTCGFGAWGALMNAEVLIVNRALRFVPGMKRLARVGMRLDEGILALPGMAGRGMQVVGMAELA